MPEDFKKTSEYVEKRYKETIDWYWNASKNNKRAYKFTRGMTIILGALVTLVASISSAEFISSNLFWDRIFSIGTPLLAAFLAIIGGFSQTFQWGASWKDMVMTAQELEKDRDRFLVTKPELRNPTKELDKLNEHIIIESRSFFQRIFGGTKPSKE